MLRYDGRCFDVEIWVGKNRCIPLAECDKDLAAYVQNSYPYDWRRMWVLSDSLAKNLNRAPFAIGRPPFLSSSASCQSHTHSSERCVDE